MLTFGSLFAGIGGIDLGLERAGMVCKWQVEIDDYATKVLNKHWPDVPKFKDIKEIKDGDLEQVDLICGGFPCQDLSYAGKRKGLDGERSGLFFELIRIVYILRPRFVLLENVPGLFTKGFGRVLGALAEGGYDAQWDCIPAQAVGAPHRRDRVFIVAYAESWLSRQSPERERREGFGGGSKKSGNASLANTGSEKSRRLSSIKWEKISEARSSGKDVPYSDGERCESEQIKKSGKDGKKRRAKCFENTKSCGNRSSAGGLSIHKTGSGKDETGKRLSDSETVLADTDNTGLQKTGTEQQTAGITGESEYVSNSDGSKTEGHGKHSWKILCESKPKGLDLRSKAEWWSVEPDVGRVANGISSRVDRLKCLGNAVVPQVAEFIGKQIIDFVNKNNDQ